MSERLVEGTFKLIDFSITLEELITRDLANNNFKLTKETWSK